MQPTILIGNTVSQILGGSPTLHRALAKVLSYEVQGSFFARRASPYWDGRVKHLNKDGFFPTGLLSLVTNFLGKKSVPFSIKDGRIAPEPSCKFDINLPWPPRYFQNDATELTDTVARGVFNIGVGGGKSTIAGMIAQRRAVPTLVVTPDTGLREQILASFIEWFGKKKVATTVVSDRPIVICNIQSLVNKDPKFFKRFKLLIIDEFHHSASKSYQTLNKWCSEAYYRYGLTGTFMRSDGSDMTMHGVLSEIIFKKSASDLIEEGFLVRPYITIFRYEIPKMRMNYQDAYNYMIREPEFNNLIARIALSKVADKKQTLVLVRRKEHGRVLNDLIRGSTYLSGDDSEERRESVKKDFINKKLNPLIATNIFGEGIDIPSIDSLINARLQKTEIQTVQGIGRALRKSDGKDCAEVADFLIVGQKHLQAHSVERIQSYKKEKSFVISLKKAN